MNIIFLDIDGVLNGYNYFTNFKLNLAWKLLDCKWFGKEKYNDVMTPIRIIDRKKVKILSKIVEENDVYRIIMTGAMRYDFEDYHYRCQNEQMTLLNYWFLRYGLYISGYTPYITRKTREDEILQWLSDNHIDDSDKFIIIDDDIQLYHKLRNHVLLTADSVIIKGHPRENTGLKKKHIKESIKLFKEV